MHRPFSLMMAVYIILLLSARAFAESGSQSFGIGVFGGYSITKCKGTPISTGPRYDAQTTCDSGATVGMWLGAQLHRYFGIEGAIATPWNKQAVTVRLGGNTVYGEKAIRLFICMPCPPLSGEGTNCSLPIPGIGTLNISMRAAGCSTWAAACECSPVKEFCSA